MNLIEKIFELLPDEKRTEFKIMVEVGDQKRIEEYIKNMLPDIEKTISDNLDKLRIVPGSYPED